jgi:ATP-dependent Clp protease protease subunit
MIKASLRALVREGGKGRLGLGIEVFRLDAVEEISEEEEVAVDEDVGDKEKSNTAIMRIYEDIGEDFWTGGGITAGKFAKELDELGDIKRLNIHINCLGGDAATAQALYNIIGDHPSKKTSYIDGVAASAATIVACGADEVIARHNTNYMVHYPWTIAMGYADELRKAADNLEKITVPIVSVYKCQVKGKIDETKIRDLMLNETWMTADEALEYGFVDQVRGKISGIAKVRGTSQIFCSGKVMNIGKYHYKNVPKYPTVESPLDEKQAGSDVKVVLSYNLKTKDKPAENEKPKGKHEMTLDELRSSHPELVASIETSARADEQIRLAALDAMAGPGLDAVIDQAKKDGKRPSDIALECYNITKARLGVQTQVNALQRDGLPISGVPAGDAPNQKVEVSKTEKGTKLLLAAQANLRNQRLRMQPNGSK